MLVVIAEEKELKLVKELGYDNYPIIITGVGALNVINSLKDIPRNTEILNIGYAGSRYFKIGQIVYIYSVNTYHKKAKFNEKPMFLNAFKCCKDNLASCYTSTDFVTKSNKKEPCVYDMELAFIRALYPNIWAIKVVSDNLNKKQYEEK